MIGVKRLTAECFLAPFSQLDVQVDVLQTDFIALHNFLAYQYFSDPEDPSPDEPAPVVAALDVGWDVTNVVVSSPQSLWFRTCGVAGHSFTRALLSDFQLSIAKAEQLKRAPEAADRLADVYEALAPVFADFLKEVRESLAIYERVDPARPVQRVVGLGGGFAQHGLLRFLQWGR